MSERKPRADVASASVLRAQDLHRTFRMGGQRLHVLRGVDITVQPGEWLAVLGASGSGKSTLLHLLGGLDRPDAGDVWFNDQQVFRLRGARLDRYRNAHVGFVFQQYHLLPELHTLGNVLIASMVGRGLFRWTGARGEARKRALTLLEELGLGERLKHRPNRLSGGERQRVAIARALVNDPDVLLADEPTGNLDAVTGGQILDVFRRFHERGQTIVMVTHDPSVAAAADRRLHLHDGSLRTD